MTLPGHIYRLGKGIAMSKKISMKYRVALATLVVAALGVGTAMAADATDAAAPPATMSQAPQHGAVSAVPGVETSGRRGADGWFCPPSCT